ncbi:MAG: hypothetical protein ACXVEE_26425 [Polyangiales bacterium]
MRVGIVLASAIAIASSARTGGPADPLPERHAGLGTENADCVSCHSDIATEWRGSLHQRSWNDPIFQAQYAIEPDPFCKSCHAPAKESEGISCASCHVKQGHVVAKNDCTGCHQFAFPDIKGHVPADGWMQSTIAEWRESPAGKQGKSCTSCHMPERDGHASHAFPALSLPTASIAVEIRREQEMVSIAFTLRAKTGHAFPTGDVFREAEIVCAVDGKDVAHSGALRRTYRLLEGPSPRPRRVANDGRLPASGAPVTLEVRLEAKPGTVIHYRLEHLRMPDSLARELALSSHNRTTLSNGSVIAP